MANQLMTWLKSKDTGLLLLLTLSSIRQAYVELLRLWWLWLVPLLLIAKISFLLNGIIPIHNVWTYALIMFLTAFLAAYCYAATRPSIDLKRLAYFIEVLPSIVKAVLILVVWWIIPFLFMILVYALLAKPMPDSVYMIHVGLWKTLTSIIVASICLFSLDRCSLSKTLINACKLIWYRFFVIITIVVISFIIQFFVALLLCYAVLFLSWLLPKLHAIWVIDWIYSWLPIDFSVILVFVFAPIFIVSWTNIYVHEVYGHLSRYAVGSKKQG